MVEDSPWITIVTSAAVATILSALLNLVAQSLERNSRHEQLLMAKAIEMALERAREDNQACQSSDEAWEPLDPFVMAALYHRALRAAFRGRPLSAKNAKPVVGVDFPLLSRSDLVTLRGVRQRAQPAVDVARDWPTRPPNEEQQKAILDANNELTRYTGDTHIVNAQARQAVNAVCRAITFMLADCHCGDADETRRYAKAVGALLNNRWGRLLELIARRSA